MSQTLHPTKKDLWFLPLGGSGEIGMNLNLYGHDGAWLMVDLGITFNDRLGIDIITPNPDFIAERAEHLAGLVLTHAHEDHVGAVPYLWPALRCPVYATRFTATVLRQKLKEVKWGHQVPIIEIPLSGHVKIGPFDIEFITLTHSIPEPNALAISTPLGRILHTGDWKLDDHPLIGDVTNQARLEALGDQGILALVCDSTNVFTPGFSGSEKEVHDSLIKMIAEFPDRRVFVGCFASNVARLQTIAKAGLANGRRVALVGRSLKKMVEAGVASGYLQDLPPFIEEDVAMDLPRGEALILVTGSQGEGRSALARIATGSHPRVGIEAGDVTIFSSRIIPGNEKAIALMQNNLVGLGVEVISTSEETIHVSGHPAQDELKMMYKWIRPRILVPVHGELRHMTAQAALGESVGIKKTIVPKNGHLIQLAGSSPGKIREVFAGRLGYDGSRLLPMESECLRERSRLSIHGAVFVTVCLDEHGSLEGKPAFSLLGLAMDEEEANDLIARATQAVRKTVGIGLSLSEVSDVLRVAIRRVFAQALNKKPVVVVHCLGS